MSKEEMEAGVREVDAFLAKFAALPLAGLSDAEANERLKGLKREFAQSKNPYVAKVLRMAG